VDERLFLNSRPRSQYEIQIARPRRGFNMSEQYTTSKGTTYTKGYALNDLIRNNRTHFKDWLCHVEDLISVMHNGEVSNVTCGQGTILGNLNDGEIELENSPVVCKKESCYCGSEVMLPKFKYDDSLRVVKKMEN
jgi:hypothetical protein